MSCSLSRSSMIVTVFAFDARWSGFVAGDPQTSCAARDLTRYACIICTISISWMHRFVSCVSCTRQAVWGSPLRRGVAANRRGMVAQFREAMMCPREKTRLHSVNVYLGKIRTALVLP